MLEKSQTFEVREELSPPAELILRLSGEFDLACVERFEEALGRRNGFRKVVIDLAGLTFMDSEAIRKLLEARKSADRDGFELFVSVPSDGRVRKVLEVAGLTDLFTPNAH